MKISFFSNFLNDHQMPLCQEFLKDSQIDFVFVAFEPIAKERLDLGFKDMNKNNFVLRVYDGENEAKMAMKLCMESDIVILGSAPEKYIKERMKKGLLTFRYSERIYKKGLYHFFSPRAMFNLYRNHRKFSNKPLYLLCASAFTSMDFARSGAYKNKAYKWGYFPEVKKYENINTVIENKKQNTLLWAGRFIDWKHPEKAIEVTRRLKAEGYVFALNMIGSGAREDDIKALISKYSLQDCVCILGSMSPEKVREYMESSQIFLFTSDRNEGWGAVLNESMNSGCAVVASSAIGSVSFLIKDGENGLIYRDDDLDDLYNKVKYLLDNPEKSKCFGEEAYKTLCEEWNAENAAKRFIDLAQAIINGENTPDIFDNGVCSKAELLKDDWYK